MNVAYNRDCMDVMREYPDGYFDLAVVDPPYGAGFTENGGNKGWFTKYHEDQRPPAERERERAEGGGTTDSAGGSTGTRLRFHGGSKNPNDPWNRYLRPTDSKKNHIVGRSAEAGIFRGAVSRLTESDHLGGQLLSSPPDKMFSDMAQINDLGFVFNGYGRICVDELQRKRKSV